MKAPGKLLHKFRCILSVHPQVAEDGRSKMESVPIDTDEFRYEGRDLSFQRLSWRGLIHRRHEVLAEPCEPSTKLKALGTSYDIARSGITPSARSRTGNDTNTDLYPPPAPSCEHSP